MERLQRRKKKKTLSILCPVVSCTAQRYTTPASDRKYRGWVRSKQSHHQSAAKVEQLIAAHPLTLQLVTAAVALPTSLQPPLT